MNSVNVEADRTKSGKLLVFGLRRALKAHLSQQENIWLFLGTWNTKNRSFFLLLSLFVKKPLKRQISLLGIKNHILIWVHFLKHNVCAEYRACLPLLCLGSRRGGKETWATLQQQVLILSTVRQVDLCRHQYVNLVRFIFFWLNRHLGHVQPGLSLYNAFILQELTGGWKAEETRWERKSTEKVVVKGNVLVECLFLLTLSFISTKHLSIQMSHTYLPNFEKTGKRKC